MFKFYIEKHQPFESLIKNGLHLDKGTSVVTTFSIFIACKSAVNSMQKSIKMGCFNLG